MRGSASLVPGRPVSRARRASWQGLVSPVHPDQEGHWPLFGSPASDLFRSDTPGPIYRREGARPLATRALKASVSDPSAEKKVRAHAACFRDLGSEFP